MKQKPETSNLILENPSATQTIWIMTMKKRIENTPNTVFLNPEQVLSDFKVCGLCFSRSK